uniref:GB1/RHD3-type G domain-containing protein n=1 Tax=Salix viminalis TaxID=40686 RepID=A0A6N2M9Z9_SALVM
MGEDCCSFHLISGDGVLNMEGLENFSRTTNLSQRGVSYAVVAIMGPQSGGKSTLLNKLFRTDFRMMDAEDGRTQTTQGIWMAKAIGIEPFIVAIDVEGSDSRERGQDGATFEKQSALFALAIADIVMINMWCHDIGREHAANRPLLKVVFEIWAEIPKPDAYKGTPLGDFFKVDRLRQRFFHSISPGGLAGDRKDVQPASGFSLRAEQIWKTIKENKDLDLPAMEVMVATFRCDRIAKETLNRLNSDEVMVATVRCDQIAKETLSRLELDETWLAMGEALKSGPVSEFGEKLSSILENYLCQYDKEAINHEESIRNENRRKLEAKALKVVRPAYAAMLQHLRSIALKSLQTRLETTVKEASGDGFEAAVDSCCQSIMRKFERGCEDATIRQVNDWVCLEENVRESLRRDMETLKSEKKAEYELISGDGVFNMEGLENFSRTTNLSQCGVTYAVVAIMGPQSGGKSTLLNKLFQTDFRMMDAGDGRNQTTQGIWTAKGIGIEPFTIAIDVEGSDSRERGQDGATFEKQSALFALAIADILMINMWCNDIGREHAANRPLLKAVFEAMIRLFRARKTTLLFVEITALPNYEYEKDEFKAKVDRLRQRFFHSISPGGLAGDRKDVQPASGFSLRAEQIWKTIKENKDLDLPAMEVMVATFRCDRIATETLSRLNSDEAWLALRKDVEARPAPNFRKNIRSILENTLSQYDKEAIHFKESIRDDKRKELETDALKVLYPAYAAMLRHLRSRALKFFETRMIKMVKRATSDGLDASIDSIVYNTMTAKAVRGLAKGIGGMTAAGVAAATFMGDGDAVASKKAGEAASTHVRRIIKRRMLNLDSFNHSTITVTPPMTLKVTPPMTVPMTLKEGMQLIDENGKFNVDGLQDFVTATEFAQSGLSYAIVAIIGSQSSGKSTLMNQTFHTKFKEMDAYNGSWQFAYNTVLAALYT